MRNGDEIEYPAILAQMDKGEDVDIVEAINAQRWRMNNQRREIAKLHAKAEALVHQRDNLIEALQAVRPMLDRGNYVSGVGIVDAVLHFCGLNKARKS